MSKKRHRSRGGSRRARIVVILIWLLYCILDGWLVCIAPPEARHGLVGGQILWMLGITIMLVAIWYRQNWARYVLCLLLGIMVILSGIAIAQALMGGAPFTLLLQIPYFLHMILKIVLNIVVILLVAYLPWLRTLTLPR